MRLLTGSQRPTSGNVTVFGSPPARFTPAQRARIGYMPQLSILYPHLSLKQNLSFVASLYGIPLPSRRRRLKSVLDFVELTPHRRKRLRDTSGGMQRRLALAALDSVFDAEWTRVDGRALRVIVDQAGTAIPLLQQWFATRGVELRSVREHVPELDDVFVKLVQAERS